MNVEGISERADVAGEGGVVDNAVQELETERTSGGTGMQKVDDFIAERVRKYGSRDGDDIRREVDEAERKFGRSEPVVLVALYVDHKEYDRIPAVIDQLDVEELTAVARVLIEDLYCEELYDQGLYGCRDSWYCRSRVRRRLFQLTYRLGHLLGAGDDEEAFDVGAAAIEDRWSIIIDALQAGFAAALRDVWHDLDWEPPLGDYDPIMDEPDNRITMAVYQCGDDLLTAPDYHQEARMKGTWLRLGRLSVEDEELIRCLKGLDAEGDGEAGVASVMVNHAGEIESNDNQNKERKMRTTEQTSELISPEAMSDAAWVEHLSTLGFKGGKDIQSLRKTNGSTEVPPADGVIVWGLRSTKTGRWIGNRDVNGVPCLQAFRTRELAEGYLYFGNQVVWMHASDWWLKVEDAAKTGFPPRVNLLCAVEDGQAMDCSWSCKALAEESAKGLQAFVEELRTAPQCISEAESGEKENSKAKETQRRIQENESCKERVREQMEKERKMGMDFKWNARPIITKREALDLVSTDLLGRDGAEIIALVRPWSNVLNRYEWHKTTETFQLNDEAFHELLDGMSKEEADNATYLEELPYETHVLDESDYARLIEANTGETV
jgi:hypothetical protein